MHQADGARPGLRKPAIARNSLWLEGQYRCRGDADYRRMSGLQLYAAAICEKRRAANCRRRHLPRQDQSGSIRPLRRALALRLLRVVADALYVSGGSSSGSAVAVAAGHVVFAVGTDTGGSGRIPAGFNEVVGIKPTIGLVSSRELVPNCPTIDCVSIFCNTVHDGEAILGVIEGFDPDDPYSRPATVSAAAGPGGTFRFGRIAPADIECFGMNDCAELYERACSRFSRLGGDAVQIDFAPFRQAGEMMFTGPWVAERRSIIAALTDIDSSGLLDVTRTGCDRHPAIPPWTPSLPFTGSIGCAGPCRTSSPVSMHSWFRRRRARLPSTTCTAIRSRSTIGSARAPAAGSRALAQWRRAAACRRKAYSEARRLSA